MKPYQIRNVWLRRLYLLVVIPFIYVIFTIAAFLDAVYKGFGMFWSYMKKLKPVCKEFNEGTVRLWSKDYKAP